MLTEPLTYDELRTMAVRPSQRGAYSDSPIDPKVGLHVHPGYDDVHVYIAGLGKIAEIYPDHTNFLYRAESMPDEFAAVLRGRLPYQDDGSETEVNHDTYREQAGEDA